MKKYYVEYISLNIIIILNNNNNYNNMDQTYLNKSKPNKSNKSNSEKEYDFLFKIVLIGNNSVGKSSIVSRFTDNVFDNTYVSTIGVDFRLKLIICKNYFTKLQIWDTSGQERFRAITSSYYRGAHGIILTYDITNRTSFNDLTYWIEEFKKYNNGETVPTVLIGNKVDLIARRTVSKLEAEKYAAENGFFYIESSAKNNTNIVNVFELLAEQILEKISKNNITENDLLLINLNKKSKRIPNNCKC